MIIPRPIATVEIDRFKDVIGEPRWAKIVEISFPPFLRRESPYSLPEHPKRTLELG